MTNTPLILKEIPKDEAIFLFGNTIIQRYSLDCVNTF